MTTLPQKELLRPDEVALFLDVSRATIYRWIEEGKLPSRKISDRLIRIPRKAVLLFVEKEDT